jgi:hypothetical protein
MSGAGKREVNQEGQTAQTGPNVWNEVVLWGQVSHTAHTLLALWLTVLSPSCATVSTIIGRHVQFTQVCTSR